MRRVRVAFLGFGLIAGSIARALRLGRRRTAGTWSRWSPTGGGAGPRARGRRAGPGRPRPRPEALDGAELVVLAAPASDCLDLLDALAGPWSGSLVAGAVVTDVASTKGQLVARADAHRPALRRRPPDGRPGCGRLRRRDGGPVRGAALGARAGRGGEHGRCGRRRVAGGGLRRPAGRDGRRGPRRRWSPRSATCRSSSPPRWSRPWRARAGGRPRPDWPEAHDLAASGWRDTTRLARGDPAMGAAIAATNAPAIAARLRDLRAVHRRLARRARAVAGGPDEARHRGAARATRQARLETDPGG